ncbi:MAG: RluA family pseudouridine synthase [Myxococcales bacterium]|jgi:23S rRNA pseudouridine1911/1915/1917 synthase|nr:RluA family pseudouridine synthase [Myxococcales bacterium]
MPLNHGYAYRSRLLPDAAEDLPLADYLARHHPHATPDEWRTRIECGEVWLDGSQARPDAPLRPGQELVWHRPPWDEPAVPTTDFEIITSDEAIVAVSKPSGLPTLPGAGFLEQTLLFQVRQRFPDAAPMHRLGRGTSGLVLFARTTAAARALQRAWQQGSVEKRYLAIASGLVPEQRTIEVPIGPVAHPTLGTIHAATTAENGKRARSRLRRIAHLDGGVRSLVEVRIDTGRPHQIRIHMAAIGHPLVGDPLYRSGGLPDPARAALPGELGYLLHAWKLDFDHPTTGRAMCLRAPLPEAWSEYRALVERGC